MSTTTQPTAGRIDARDEMFAHRELIPVVVPLLALAPALVMVLIFWAVV